MIPILVALLLQTGPAEVPVVFRGDWAQDAADCASPALRLTIDARGVQRGAGVWHPAEARTMRLDATGLQWSYTSNDPESGPWETRYRLGAPQGDRMTLVRDGKDGPRTFSLQRCAATG